MKKIYIIFIALFCIVTPCLYVLGKNVSFSEQWPLYESLRSTSAIVFAIVGSWLAIIYPNKLRTTFTHENFKSNENNVNFGIFFKPAIHSSIILTCILLIGILAPIAKQLIINEEYISYCRGLSYISLFYLTIWQIFTILLTLIPADSLKFHEDTNNIIYQNKANRRILVNKKNNL